MSSLSKTNMKEYFLRKIFGPNGQSNQSTNISNRFQNTSHSDPLEWEFYPDYNNHTPLPEGLVLDSPVYGAPAFHSPTPPSPPHRLTRSVSLETEKSSRTWDMNVIQQSLKRRLSWIRSSVSKLDLTPSHEHVIEPYTIETIQTPEPLRDTPSTSNNSFLESIAEEIEIIEIPDDARVTFCEEPSRYEFESVETLDELVVRISDGFPEHDIRPAHCKLLGFCTKSLTYLRYRESPCAEVFSLGSSDISMWRRLGHYDWDCDDGNQIDDIEICCKSRVRDSDESTASEESDLHEASPELDEVTMRGSPRIAIVDKDVSALVEVMNSVLCKGDECFTDADIKHLCQEVEYPGIDDSVEDDGWC